MSLRGETTNRGAIPASVSTRMLDIETVSLSLAAFRMHGRRSEEPGIDSTVKPKCGFFSRPTIVGLVTAAASIASR